MVGRPPRRLRTTRHTTRFNYYHKNFPLTDLNFIITQGISALSCAAKATVIVILPVFRQKTFPRPKNTGASTRQLGIWAASINSMKDAKMTSCFSGLLFTYQIVKRRYNSDLRNVRNTYILIEQSQLIFCYSPGFFHRFCGNKHNRISETLSLGAKSLSLAENPWV